MSEPLRIGVLGASRIGSLSIASPARATGARLVAIAARRRERAEEWAAENGVERVVDSYQALLEDPEVEAVYNPLPNGLHGEWNLRAILAGKHVLSEKPFASNAEQAAAVVAAGRAAGLVVLEAFHYPFHPNFHRVCELLEGGAIGNLVQVEAPMRMPPPGPDDPRWQFELAGGALMDVGCYAVHCVRQLGRFAGGEPEVVQARAVVHPDHPDVDQRISADLRYPGGATAIAGGSMDAASFDFHLTITGTAGRIHLPDFPRPHEDSTLVWTDAQGTEHREDGGSRSSYTYQLEGFTDAVRTGAALPYDDAAEQMAMIDAIYRAAGLPVRPVTAAQA
ncbi:MAG: Gfo/Idh/MocA family protein [Actinomycetales bacterium]